MSNPLSNMIGNFILGLLDGVIRKWLAQYVKPGKLDEADVDQIVTGIHGDMKLAMVMEQGKPAT